MCNVHYKMETACSNKTSFIRYIIIICNVQYFSTFGDMQFIERHECMTKTIIIYQTVNGKILVIKLCKVDKKA